MRAPIKSIKHYTHTVATGVASGALQSITVVSAIAKGATVASDFEVEEGAIIKAVYCEYWVRADEAKFTVNGALLKRPANVTSPTFADMQNLGAYPNKKNILEFHQGLAPTGDQTLALFRSWYKIPKGKQRFGLGDKLNIVLTFTGSAGDVCGFSTYKEYE